MFTFRVLVVAAVSAFIASACGPSDVNVDDDVRAQFPDVAARALADDGEPFVADAERRFVAPAGADSLAAADAAIPRIAVSLPNYADDAVTLGLFDGFALELRETGIAGQGEAAGGHVRYRRADGAGASYWSRAADGMEEWLHVVDPEPGVIATWTISGARLVMHEDGSVGVIDAEGHERLRVAATEAFGASGKAVQARLEIRGADELALAVGDDVVGEASILVDPTWIPAGSMIFARDRFTATALPNGKVLVAGGLNGNTYLSACELYDPSSGLWSPAHAMQSPRAQHAAVLLPNGNVLVSGGLGTGGVMLASAEYYVPSIDNWIGVQWMPHVHTGHTATLLTNGKVLVAAGATTYAELYDPSTQLWSSTGSLAAMRSDNTATRIANGKVLVVGGLTFGTYLTSAEIYTESTGQWTATTSLPVGQGRADHTATLLRSGQVLVAGGQNASGFPLAAYRFNPQTSSWTAAGSLVQGRIFHTATLLPNDRVVLIGGHFNSGYATYFETYNASSDTWGAQTAPTQRSYHTAVMLESGRVLIAGGQSLNTIASAYVFNPAFSNDTWTQTSQMLAAELSHSATVTQLSDGSVLLVGHFQPVGQPLSPGTYEGVRFDPNTGLSTATGPLAYNPFAHTATLMLDGRVLVANGGTATWGGSSWQYNDDTIQSQIYDPSTNAWTAGTWSNYPRKSARAVLLPSGKVFVVGGVGANCAPPFNCMANWLPPPELYDPTTRTWTVVGNTGFFGHTANLMRNGDVLVVGGTNWWDWSNSGGPGNPSANAGVFSSTSEQFTAWPVMQNARCNHTATSLADGRVAVLGGSSLQCDGNGSGVAPVEIYNPASGTFTTAGNMLYPRVGHATSMLVNGFVMTTGGVNNGTSTFFIEQTELFDPSTGNSYPGPRLHRSYGAPQLLLPTNKVAQFSWCYPDNVNSVPCDPRPIWSYDEGRSVVSAPPSIAGLTSNVAPGGSMTIIGNGMFPDAEGTQGAATNTAQVLLQRMATENQIMAPVTSVSSSSLTATVPSSTPRGWYLARVIVNGIASTGRPIVVQ